MDEAHVVAAIATLSREGKTPSIGNLRKALGGGSFRDITRLRKKLLPPQREEAPMETPVAAPAPAPVAASPPPPPVPLLAQAELEHQAALVDERHIRRALASPGGPYTSDDLAAAVRRTRQAQALVDTRQRSTTALQQAVPELRIAARRSAGSGDARPGRAGSGQAGGCRRGTG